MQLQSRLLRCVNVLQNMEPFPDLCVASSPKQLRINSRTPHPHHTPLPRTAMAFLFECQNWPLIVVTWEELLHCQECRSLFGRMMVEAYCWWGVTGNRCVCPCRGRDSLKLASATQPVPDIPLPHSKPSGICQPARKLFVKQPQALLHVFIHPGHAGTLGHMGGWHMCPSSGPASPPLHPLLI